MVRHPALFAALAITACTAFQSQDIVVDIRVIAMEANLPEQLVDIPSFVDPPPLATLVAQIQPTQVCALVADPTHMRSLRWSMTLCNYNEDERCDDNGDPQELLGSGLEPSPDYTVPEPSMCATVQPDATFVGVIENALANDPLDGLQGLDYSVVLRVGGSDADPSLDLYAEKMLQLAAKDPPDRTPNTNPYLTDVTVQIGDPDSEDLSAPVVLPFGRCVDQTTPFAMPAGKKARITPVEPPGVRQVYTLPTLDGSDETFVESLTYQWTATAGDFDNGTTGGPADVLGNLPPLFTDWIAPDASQVGSAGSDVPLWIVQRDERFGVHWYESCIHVMP
jgi:hypothetical protein